VIVTDGYVEAIEKRQVAALGVDPEAYAQIEAGLWCDRLWLSGGYAARGPALDVERIAAEALEFRDALWQASCGRELARCGPDGKLIVRLKEDADGFALEHVLVTLEHPEPLSDAGSRKDSGQTGRTLVMDYYGPRLPLGGGAIYGKPPTHVDRFGARVARELAIDAVKRGAGQCLIRAVYAPNVAEPLDVQVEVTGRGGDIRVPHDALALR
jgi:hypothetical protein